MLADPGGMGPLAKWVFTLLYVLFFNAFEIVCAVVWLLNCHRRGRSCRRTVPLSHNVTVLPKILEPRKRMCRSPFRSATETVQ